MFKKKKSEAEQIVDEQYEKIKKELGPKLFNKLQVGAFFESTIGGLPTILDMQKDIDTVRDSCYLLRKEHHDRLLKLEKEIEELKEWRRVFREGVKDIGSHQD